MFWTLDIVIHIGFIVAERSKNWVFSRVEEWEKDPNLLGLFERTTYACSKSFK